MSLVITLLAVVAAVTYYLLRKSFTYWKDKGVHQFPLTFPHGNAKGVFRDFHISEFLVKYYQKTKEIGAAFSGVYFFIRPTLFVVDLDLIKTILVKDFNVFVSRGIYYNEKDDPVSAHLFNLDGEMWRNLRHKLSPTFTSGKLKMMFGTISDVVDTLLSVIDKQVEQNGHMELKDTLARFTTDVIGNIAFGIDCNSLQEKNSKFYEMGTRIFTPTNSKFGFFTRIMKNNFKDLSRKLHMKVLPDDLSEFYLGITKQTVEYREKNPQVNRQDFINLLVQLKKENAVTVEQIAAQSFVFFLAGYETSSSTMTYCMFELSINEQIQEKARQCVLDAIKKHGSLNYDAVGDMDYLEQCVDETLRKYPVVSTLTRSPSHEYTIPDTKVTIPAGQSIFIPVHAIHHDPEIYPEPEKFIPERFTPEEKSNRHPFAYLPFGEGPRICIGMRWVKNNFFVIKFLIFTDLQIRNR